MKNAQRTAITREELLRATTRIVSRVGIPGLTLDAVAREAGISKGGLLHHFSNKEALIRNLVEFYISELNAAFEREYEADPKPDLPGRWLRAFIRVSFASFDPADSLTLGTAQNDIAGTLGGLMSYPECLELLQREYDRWHELMISDGIHPALATAIRFAADGIYFAEAYGFAPPTGKTREETMNVILGWATPDDARITAKKRKSSKP
jgi:AcrR family transcriptional regulator